jgi:tRNA G18 (ribose-2'-O)-methylase SpoU
METNFNVRSLDADISLEEYRTLPKTPIFIVLDNIRSAFNVGSIFRLCDSIRAAGLFLCGCTAFPPHLKLQKTSMGTVDYVPWMRFEKTIDAIGYLKERNVPVWAVETTSASKRYDRIEYPREIGLVFGNEALGVSGEALGLCDAIIEIPMLGFKNSINVAAACAVIACRFAYKKAPTV